ncbi:MAG TPA: penicillin acylase family protein [Thermoanaerobaculia bacterium]|nr:penicillin acylase family protein [Thermoanaerobaculia bacterium]
MRRRSKALLALAAVVLVLAVALAGAFLWWSRGGLPRRDGEAALAGLAAPVVVRWDARAVPYVEAESPEDLAAALGWLHANDRMTQMELGRRLAAGRLSELAGEAAIGVDTRSRRMGFRRGAERLWDEAGAESRRWLAAYARGVNAWLAGRDGDLPPGLLLLGGPGFVPEPWGPVDSLSFVFLMGEDLSFWQGRPEEERFRWLAALGPERTRDLLGGGELHVPEEIAALAASLIRTDADGTLLGAARRPPDGAPGSNNWAVAGARTRSGAPLVANDPHLGLGVPGTWYQVHLRAPGIEAAGMSLPGVPGIVIGRGRAVAWAFTNVMLDDHDVFFEQVERRPDGREAVRRGEGWLPVEVTRETIRVDGGEAIEIDVRRTDRGPLLAADPDRGLPPRSLAWTLDEGGDPISAFLALARAGGVAEAAAGIGGYVGPAQNLVLADVHGGLLWTILGRAPDRLRGDGRLPSPGWSPEYGWRGLLPRESTPAIAAPADGLLVTANARVAPPDPAFPLSADFDTPHRARRIRELLAAGDGWDAAATAALQADVVSLFARDLLAAALPALPPGLDGDAAAARDLLAGWDGTMAAADAAGRPLPAAALFPFVELRLRGAVFADEELAYAVDVASADRVLWALDGTLDAAWLDDVSTPEPETKGEIVARALAAAWRDAVDRWGADTARWDYEELHRLTLGHPLSAVPVLGRFFTRGPFPMPGSGTTVAAFGARWVDGELRVAHGPSMRWIADLGAPDASLAVLPAGQSGHPFDPHYDDQTAAWRAGRAFPFPWTEEAIERQAVERLTLRPAAE